MKASILFLFVLTTVSAFSQNTINNYKYVLVPEKFEFQRESDQYSLNTATKIMLEQKGFVVYRLNDQLPPDLAGNKCKALLADVVQKKGFLVTNLILQLKDCQGVVVFKGKEGKSREKEFHPAFNEALRAAFVSLNEAPYKYDSSVAGQGGATNTTTASAAAAAPVTGSAAPAAATGSNGSPASAAVSTVGDITGTLYAQAIDNGYQLVDTSPKKVLTLLKSSTTDYYIAEAGATHGVVFKKDNEWVFEYYKDGKLVSQKLQIRF